jgi:hypothetical protein
MKLHLILLVTLFSLSSGFMVELRGPLTEDPCDGEEYGEFMHCVTKGAAADPNLPVLNVLEEKALFSPVNLGGERQLGGTANDCTGCTGEEPRGTFCFTFCSTGRRLQEQGTDSPNMLRRPSQKLDSVAVFERGAYTGNEEAKLIAEDIVKCLGDVSTSHPCLGSTDTMILTVTL